MLCTCTWLKAQTEKEEPSYSYFFLKGGFASSDMTSFRDNDIQKLEKEPRRVKWRTWGITCHCSLVCNQTRVAFYTKGNEYIR